MPPADDNTPDFDSMSPEELMAWMETLAERQGAVEGFTTDERVDIAEVDPDSVDDTGPGYIPYGMTEDEWAEKQAQEEAEKAARLAAKQDAPAPAPAEPVAETAPEPEPVVEAAAASAPAGDDDAPDFDSMSPEEMMAWMETLAERQGAVEGFTTDERVDIAEVDPDSVDDTGPGYIPYGMTEDEWAEKQAQEEAEKAARLAARQDTPAPAPAEPVAEAAPEPEPTPDLEPIAELPDFDQIAEEQAPQDVFELPELDLGVDLDASTQLADAADAGMDWLESLSAEQGGDAQLDLSGLGGDLDISALDAEPAIEMAADADEEDAVDPVAWLDNLAQDDSGAFDLPTDDVVSDDAAPVAATGPSADDDVDPIQWLESLAERQGADPEEFITPAGLDIPEATADADAQTYTDYAVEQEDVPAEAAEAAPDLSFVDALDAPSADADDPAAWLDQLASSQKGEAPRFELVEEDEVPQESDESIAVMPEAEATGEADDIMSRLNSAQDVTAEEMKGWMDNLLEKGAQRTDVPDYVETDDIDEDQELEASIPEWLIEQVGPPPDLDGDAEEEAAVESDEPPPEELLAALDDVAEVSEETLPDWLQEDAETSAESDLENLFVEADAPATPPAAASVGDSAEIDTSDPWVEAFELERQEGAGGVEAPAPAPTAAAPPVPDDVLEVATFEPDASLAAGEPEALPDWLEAPVEVDAGEMMTADMPAFTEDITVADSEQTTEIPAWLQEHVEDGQTVEVPATEDMPTWLQDADFDPTDTIPEWLIETVATDEAPAFTPPPPAPTKQPTTTPAVPATPASPVSPAPAPVLDIDVDATLQSARSQIEGGDLEAGLRDYELVIQANAQLDDVALEVERLSKDPNHKNSAAVHRVLGDALMRQGKLQDALNTYRRALNLL